MYSIHVGRTPRWEAMVSNDNDELEFNDFLDAKYARYISPNTASVLQAIKNLGGAATATQIIGELANVNPQNFANTAYKSAVPFQNLPVETLRPSLASALQRLVEREILLIEVRKALMANGKYRSMKHYLTTRTSELTLAAVTVADVNIPNDPFLLQSTDEPSAASSPADGVPPVDDYPLR